MEVNLSKENINLLKKLRIIENIREKAEGNQDILYLTGYFKLANNFNQTFTAFEILEILNEYLEENK